MISMIRFALILLLTCLPTFVHAEEALDQETLEQDALYRVNPTIGKLSVVPKEEIKLGFVYKYFNPQLSQHVWGIAVEGGKFRFALGPGSMQPAGRFDLRISESQKQQLFEERAPALSRGVESMGRDVFAQLQTDDTWKVYLSTSIPKAYDRMTHRRWEWHGNRRVGVLHTHGPFWIWEDGRYQPMAISYQ